MLTCYKGLGVKSSLDYGGRGGNLMAAPNYRNRFKRRFRSWGMGGTVAGLRFFTRKSISVPLSIIAPPFWRPLSKYFPAGNK